MQAAVSIAYVFGGGLRELSLLGCLHDRERRPINFLIWYRGGDSEGGEMQEA